MRTKLGIVVASVLLGAFATITIGATTVNGKEVIHVVLPAETLHVKFLDFGKDGMRLGDRVVTRGTLLDESRTNTVGTSHSECLVQRRLTDGGLWRCSYLLELENGDILLEGLDPRGVGSSAFAVTGGTGAYSNAQGDATFSDSETETDMVINLP